MATLFTFRDFVDAHEAAFSGFRKWLTAADDNGEPTRDGEARVDLWKRTLAEFPVEMLIAASEALNLRRERPRWYDEHLPELVWLCKAKQSLTRPADPRFLRRCEMCRGGGLIEVYPRIQQFFRSHGGTYFGLDDSFSVRCPCSRGEKFPAFRAFDEATMERYAERFARTAPSPESVADRIQDWKRDAAQRGPVNPFARPSTGARE